MGLRKNGRAGIDTGAFFALWHTGLFRNAVKI